jgi:hypothetical protein
MPAVLKRLMRHASIGTTMAFYVALDSDEIADQLWANCGPTGGNSPPLGNTGGNTAPNSAGDHGRETDLNPLHGKGI